MKQGIFRDFNPVSKLFLYFFVSFTSYMIFMAFGTGILKMLWNIDILTEQNILNQHNLPNVIEANRLLMACLHLGMFVLPPLLFTQLIGEDRFNFLLLKLNSSLPTILVSILIIFSCQPIINALVAFNESFRLPEALAELENSIKQMEDSQNLKFEALLTVDSAMGLLANILVIAIIPALGEELMFRGVVQKLFIRIFKNYHIGIWASAILFSALHFQFYGFIPRTLLGALFGYMAIWTGTLWIPIMAHFLNNFSAVVLDYMTRQGTISDQVNNIGSNNDYLSWFIGGIITLGLIWYLKRGSQWENNKKIYLEGEQQSTISTNKD